MTYRFALVLDEKRLERIRGTPLESLIKSSFGGRVKLLDFEVPEDVAKRILSEFPAARVDSRGYIEDVPVAFRRAVFEAVAKHKSTGREVWDEVFSRLEEIKQMAAKEKEYLPPPE